MELGTFSISLTVKDIQASRAFYEKLGFTQYDGDPAQNWIILKNGDTFIGLFQGMFDANILTFHPKDVRAIQKQLVAKGITPVQGVEDEDGEGAAHFTLIDPDGNPLLFDQFTDDYKPDPK